MYSIYQTMINDTLESVSSMFNTDVDTLRKINGLSSITPGSMIVVPNSNLDNLNVYTVQKGDNLYNIATNYSVDVKTLQNLNGLDADDYIYAGQQILVPKSNVGVYIVGENETLDSISKKIGIDRIQLINNNEKIYLLPEQLLFFKKREIS